MRHVSSADITCRTSLASAPDTNFTTASRDARVTRRLGSLRYNSRRASLTKLRSEDVGVRDARPLGHNAMLWVSLFQAERGRNAESLSRPE